MFENVLYQPFCLNSNTEYNKKLLYSDSLIGKNEVNMSNILNDDLTLLITVHISDKCAFQ